jgi:hypothetical protein
MENNIDNKEIKIDNELEEMKKAYEQKLKQKKKQKEYKQTHKETVNACTKRYYEKRKQDPEFLEKRRQKQREQYQKKKLQEKKDI